MSEKIICSQTGKEISGYDGGVTIDVQFSDQARYYIFKDIDLHFNDGKLDIDKSLQWEDFTECDIHEVFPKIDVKIQSPFLDNDSHTELSLKNTSCASEINNLKLLDPYVEWATSEDDMIYAVDSDGNALSGWPMAVNGTIGGSVVFSDLDGDGEPEVVAATDAGDVLAYHLDGSTYTYFPIANEFPFSSSPMIIDLDNDGDLEILTGSGSNLFVVDIKDMGSSSSYWNMYRGNMQRSGYYVFGDDTGCGVELGDVSGDGNINILDLVQISNYILDVSTPAYACAADFTGDGNVNILDLVQVANFILDN